MKFSHSQVLDNTKEKDFNFTFLKINFSSFSVLNQLAMAFKVLLTLFAIFSVSFAQTISCDFWEYAPSYFCDLTINNPTGYDSFTSIAGTHVPGKSNADVTHLSTSGITSSNFPRIICDSFPNLLVIHFTNLGKNVIEDTAFANCARLESLDLYGNEISSISANAFANNRALYHLSLANNHLTSLPAGLLTNLVALEEFEINRNQITALPATFFNGLNNLKDVRMLGNNFTTWNAAWFSNKNSLAYLDVGVNQFTSIPSGAFSASNSLTRLYIDHNRFTELRMASFSNNVNALGYLYASDNQISIIDRAVLESPPELYAVDLERNVCADLSFYDFNTNRGNYLAQLSACFP